MTDWKNRLKILFLPPPPHREQPWREDIIQAIDKRHDLIIWNRDLALDGQFERVDVVIDASGSPPLRQMADLATSVKLWQLQSVGYDSFNIEYWRQKGISVANCPGSASAGAVAECAFMLMLMLSRFWTENQANLHRGRLYLPKGRELENRRLGLIGFGASARQLAPKARSFGMQVSAIDVLHISVEEQSQFGLEFAGGPEDLDMLLRQSDFVSLHVPLNRQTRYLMNASRLELMKTTAILINVARGGLVDQEALYQALNQRRLAGAGLDVFESEPVDPDHPLLQLPNLLATPHIAGNTYEISRRRARFAADNIERVAAGEMPLCLISGAQKDDKPASLTIK